nr:hypothetical protein BEI47_18910 [Aliivibrio fischeri]
MLFTVSLFFTVNKTLNYKILLHHNIKPSFQSNNSVQLVKAPKLEVKLSKEKNMTVKPVKPVKPVKAHDKVISNSKRKLKSTIKNNSTKTKEKELASLFNDTSLDINIDNNLIEPERDHFSDKKISKIEDNKKSFKLNTNTIKVKVKKEPKERIHSELRTLQKNYSQEIAAKQISSIFFNLKRNIKKEVIAYGIENVQLDFYLKLKNGKIISLNVDTLSLPTPLLSRFRNLLIGLEINEKYTGNVQHNVVIL